MNTIRGYSDLVHLFQKKLFQTSGIIEHSNLDPQAAESLWKRFKEQFVALVVFILSKGVSGDKFELSFSELITIEQFFRFAQYSLLSGLNVPIYKMSYFISGLPDFIANSTIEVSYIGVRPNDKISISITAPIEIYDFTYEFSYPIAYHDFNNRHWQLYDDISNKWVGSYQENGNEYMFEHSVADIIKAGSFDAFILQFVNSNPVVLSIFMKYYQKLNLRGINCSFENIQDECKVQKDIVSRSVPNNILIKYHELKSLQSTFMKNHNKLPKPTQANLGLYKYSLLPGLVYCEENKQFYCSDQYDKSTQTATLLMEFYNLYCLNSSMQEILLPQLKRIAIVQGEQADINVFNARFRDLDFTCKEQLLSKNEIKYLEDKMRAEIEYEKILDKIDSIEYDPQYHQLKIQSTMTKSDYEKLTTALKHNQEVTVQYSEKSIIVQFLPNLTSFLQECSKSRLDKIDPDFERYLSVLVYQQPNNHNLKAQEHMYNKFMQLKKEVQQHKQNPKIRKTFEQISQEQSDLRLKTIIQSVLATLFTAIENNSFGRY
jgi:hypothetical protein